MGELKYIVMDGCMLLNKGSTTSENCKERKRQAVLFGGVRTLTVTVEKLKRIPVTIFLQYVASMAGQPEAAPFGPCCSCSFY